MSTAYRDEPAKPAKPVARAVIHDLGYKRYDGPRLPQATRWVVVMRNQLSFAWKSWWRLKAWIGLSVLITVALGAIMVALRTEQFEGLVRNGQIVSLVDGLVFSSIAFYGYVGFLLSLTCGGAVVTNDLRTGAFTFYFSRPVRPIDYMLGKLCGLFLVQASVILAPMLILTGLRLGLSSSSDDLLQTLELIPKVILVGGLGALAFASISLAFSSMARNRGITLGVWAGWYCVASSIFRQIAVHNGAPDVGAVFDFQFGLTNLSLHLFGATVSEGPALASPMGTVIAVSATIAAAIGFTFWRVRAAAHAGIGGG